MTSRDRRPGVSELPALAAFLRGYLHQDALVEHGSARAAMEAFCRDANVFERQELLGQVDVLMASGGSRRSMREIRRVLEHLGSAWTPRTRAQLDEMVAILRAAS